MARTIRYLLLQVRNSDDPMAEHEVRCFARALRCATKQITIYDLLGGTPTPAELDRYDIVLLGGSGDYSVSKGGDWMHPAMEAMRELHTMSKPTFASCWGFQAMAAALGGRVVEDLSRAEVGSHHLTLTAAGREDPVFAPMGNTFVAQMGHQDIVDELPEGAVLLASSRRVVNQAFRFEGKPIYCTQFHPELSRVTLLDRLRAYPQYVEKIERVSFETFVMRTVDSLETDTLLVRFIAHVIDKL